MRWPKLFEFVLKVTEAESLYVCVHALVCTPVCVHISNKQHVANAVLATILALLPMPALKKKFLEVSLA